MKYLLLRSPRWETAEATPDLAEADWRAITPRLSKDPNGGLWADTWGLDARDVARALARLLPEEERPEVRACAADVQVVAEVLVRYHPSAFTTVAKEKSAAAIAPFPVSALSPSRSLAAQLDGVGITTIGALAQTDGAAVETRFGKPGIKLWHLARGHDLRSPLPAFDPGLPTADKDYADAPLFSLVAVQHEVSVLATPILEALGRQGVAVQSVRIDLACEDASSATTRVFVPRPTRDVQAFLRMANERLERLVLNDRVVGVAVQVESLHAVESRQAELFEAENSALEIIEPLIGNIENTYGTIIRGPKPLGTAQPEGRTAWVEASLPARLALPDPEETPFGLALQLLPDPTAINVRLDGESRPRSLQVRERWIDVTSVTQRQDLSGGWWRDDFERTYWSCLTASGELLWVYRDAAQDSWYLHGRWE